jgi:hypothetical protein
MNTRPAGLHTPAMPLTESEPRAVAATPEEWDEAVAEHAARYIPYSPAATEKQLAQYRLEKDLDREARSRNVQPAPLCAPEGGR